MSPGDLSLLLVDDIEENLLALEAALEPMGHRIVKARSGEEALRQMLRNEEFAAVVLDVQMPGLDGFETARAIQERERTKDVPILFLTAISRDEDHRLRGFATGAVDYIFKPVDPEVLRAKVGVFVRLYAADRELRRQREDLRRQAAELARSNADLDQFASVVSHDLLDPLNVISGYLELMADRFDDGSAPEVRIWIERMDGCARRVHKLVADLLDYSRAVAGDEAATPPSTLLSDPLADALANLDVLITSSGTTVETAGDLPAVAARREELAQVFQNLVANAIVHRGDQPVHVVISADSADTEVAVRVSDDGPGLSPAQMERVFAMFERTGDGPTPSTGLGLSICRRIVQRAGGRIQMVPNQGAGVSVIFTLPTPP